MNKKRLVTQGEAFFFLFSIAQVEFFFSLYTALCNMDKKKGFSM